MKRAQSVLIDRFIRGVRHGDISVTDGVSGWDDTGLFYVELSSNHDALRSLVQALISIQHGADPIDALGLSYGPERDTQWDYISRIVHNNLKRRVKAVAITAMVGEYLSSIGREPVSWQAIKKIYDLRKPDLDAQDSRLDMMKFIREH